MKTSTLNRDVLCLVQDAYTAGMCKGLEIAGKLSRYITLSEAYKTYGRATVDRWRREGLIAVIKDGSATSKCRISREEIALVASMSNRASYFANLPSEVGCD